MKTASSQPVNFKLFALVTLIAVGVMFMAMIIKPMWRDEYWSLFFSDASVDFSTLLQGRLRDEVHPPLYYFFLHYWQNVFGSVFGMRLLSIVMLGLTTIGLFKLTPDDRKMHLKAFLLVCLGSYWVIYFVSEIRPYVMLFCLVALSVFLIPKFLQSGEPQKRYYIYWLLCGAALGLTHYFGGLWFACAALITGISTWQAGYKYRFFILGFASVIGLLPLVGWLLWSLPVLDLSDEQSMRSIYEKFEFASSQYFRGLLVKTFASNPIVTIIGFGGIIAALKFKNRLHSTLILSVILASFLAFLLHFTFVELIKERAFIVIMPALLFILSSELVERHSKFMKYLPIATAVMPILFLGEYFKNREKIPELQKYIASYASECESADLLAYYRPTLQPEFYPMATERIMTTGRLKSLSEYNILDARIAKAFNNSECPIKAIAVLMPKNNDELTTEAMSLFSKAGLNEGGLTEHRFGSGRNIVWTSP